MGNKNVNVDQLTEEILEYKNKAVENAIEIGKRLIKIKERLKHGEFGKYLKEQVDFSQNTANKYMRVVVEFSNCSLTNNLEPTKLIELLEVPKEYKEDFINNNDLKNMSCREIRQKIKEIKSSLKPPKKTKAKDKPSKTKTEEDQENKTNNTKDNNSNYDADGSFDPFKNFKNAEYKSFFEDFDFSQFKQKQLLLDVTEEEKKTLKKFYNTLAKQCHPDKGGNEDEMKLLNKLKEEWGI